jgi:twin arginine-targeting protein translocase, TatA/E family
MLGNIGPWEIGFILIIVLIIFGPGKLPQLGESLGKAIHSFRSARETDAEDSDKSNNAKGA